MAKLIKNITDLKKQLAPKLRAAIEETQLTAMQDVNKQAVAFYNDYDPVMYRRTGQLSGTPMTDANSFIQMSPINATNDGYEASVYLDADNLSYTTGKSPTGEQVMSTAVQGLHGVKDGDGWRYVSGNTGEKLWNDGLQKKATDDLVEALMKQGIPITKG